MFNSLKSPIFLKSTSNAEFQLQKLHEIEPKLNPEGKALIQQDIKFLEYGIAGEKNVAFELKNSGMPMYILHDIYLTDGDLSAQIDYMVFTRKLCFVIECKNLFGNIEINSAGDFIRSMSVGGKIRKEGIYSPITQNERHLQVIKKVKTESRNNFLTKFLTERYFDSFYHSVVVLANPRTILNAKYAKKEVKQKVIRADQLIAYIKEANSQSKESNSSDNNMKEWADSFLQLHKEQTCDYTAKYEKYYIANQTSTVASDSVQTAAETTKEITPKSVLYRVSEEKIEDTEIFKELKAYRLKKSREENIKPYYIVNDAQLKELISKMPATGNELLLIPGFGEKKVTQYGPAILSILERYRKQ